MTIHRLFPKPLADIEKPHEVVADSIGDGLPSQPLTSRLGDLWTDLVRVAGDSSAVPDAPKRSPAAVPLLDDMKGILQWD